METDLKDSAIYNECQLAEMEFWKANKEQFNQEYPANYLIIRGQQVTGVYPSFQELAEAEQDEPDENYLVCWTDGIHLPIAVMPTNIITRED